ncbi:hypothetical protein JCM33374_g2223 [Metschnikowia sp. JCM 33374]|nr:hypothetical protein JCM33374_g2223 [Metschnikowia sp. JCM 33374]
MSVVSPLGDTFGKRLSAYLTTPQDFRKHRQRLSRELLRVRHELNIVTRDTKNYRDSQQTSSIDASKYAENPQFGRVLLLLAERSYVHSLEIKSMLELKGQQIPGYRKLMAGKLKSAVATCRQLTSTVAAESNQHKKLEFFLYAALIEGSYAVSKKNWAAARHAFSLARVGLEFLGASLNSAPEGNSSDDSLFGKTLIDEILDTLVDPSLTLAHSQDSVESKTSADLRTIARKHCRDATLSHLHPIVDIVTAIDPSFVAEIVEENVPKSVTWRAHEAAIYNDELALKLHKLAQEFWQSYTDANDYDSLYSRWSALVDIHQADLDKSNDEDDAEKTQDNAVLLTYIKYNMLFVKVKRDLLLINQLHTQPKASTAKLLGTLKDASRLYSSVISTTEELKDLPGVYNDDDLFESLEELSRLFTVTRSALIADAYAAANKLPEALKIYIHIERTFPAAESYFKVDAFPYEVSSNEQVQEFRRSISSQKAQIHTLAQLHRESEGVVPSTVAENVYKFPASVESLQNITNIDQKGAVVPVLSKPVLFDVAFNYIGYSVEGERTLSKSSSGKTENESDSTGEKKKGGFFGIFGRG